MVFETKPLKMIDGYARRFKQLAKKRWIAPPTVVDTTVYHVRRRVKVILKMLDVVLNKFLKFMLAK